MKKGDLGRLFQKQPELAAGVFGVSLFLGLGIFTTLWFGVFWTSFKGGGYLSLLFLPVIILLLPGGIIHTLVVMLLPSIARIDPSVLWFVISFWSAIFWSLIVYLFVGLPMRFRRGRERKGA